MVYECCCIYICKHVRHRHIDTNRRIGEEETGIRRSSHNKVNVAQVRPLKDVSGLRRSEHRF